MPRFRACRIATMPSRCQVNITYSSKRPTNGMITRQIDKCLAHRVVIITTFGRRSELCGIHPYIICIVNVVFSCEMIRCQTERRTVEQCLVHVKNRKVHYRTYFDHAINSLLAPIWIMDKYVSLQPIGFKQARAVRLSVVIRHRMQSLYLNKYACVMYK